HRSQRLAFLPVIYFVAFVFFFQAEDGIRDRNVTGVQTCALPILSATSPTRVERRNDKNDKKQDAPAHTVFLDPRSIPCRYTPQRSEERRVGKECRARGSPWTGKKQGGMKRCEG